MPHRRRGGGRLPLICDSADGAAELELRALARPPLAANRLSIAKNDHVVPKSSGGPSAHHSCELGTRSAGLAANSPHTPPSAIARQTQNAPPTLRAARSRMHTATRFRLIHLRRYSVGTTRGDHNSIPLPTIRVARARKSSSHRTRQQLSEMNYHGIAIELFVESARLDDDSGKKRSATTGKLESRTCSSDSRSTEFHLPIAYTGPRPGVRCLPKVRTCPLCQREWTRGLWRIDGHREEVTPDEHGSPLKDASTKGLTHVSDSLAYLIEKEHSGLRMKTRRKPLFG